MSVPHRQWVADCIAALGEISPTHHSPTRARARFTTRYSRSCRFPPPWHWRSLPISRLSSLGSLPLCGIGPPRVSPRGPRQPPSPSPLDPAAPRPATSPSVPLCPSRAPRAAPRMPAARLPVAGMPASRRARMRAARSPLDALRHRLALLSDRRLAAPPHLGLVRGAPPRRPLTRARMHKS